jgi:hypothetical protein
MEQPRSSDHERPRRPELGDADQFGGPDQGDSEGGRTLGVYNEELDDSRQWRAHRLGFYTRLLSYRWKLIEVAESHERVWNAALALLDRENLVAVAKLKDGLREHGELCAERQSGRRGRSQSGGVRHLLPLEYRLKQVEDEVRRWADQVVEEGDRLKRWYSTGGEFGNYYSGVRWEGEASIGFLMYKILSLRETNLRAPEMERLIDLARRSARLSEETLIESILEEFELRVRPEWGDEYSMYSPEGKTMCCLDYALMFAFKQFGEEEGSNENGSVDIVLEPAGEVKPGRLGLVLLEESHRVKRDGREPASFGGNAIDFMPFKHFGPGNP